MCATSGLPSTPSYLLHNTTRVVARTPLHSTVTSIHRQSPAVRRRPLPSLGSPTVPGRHSQSPVTPHRPLPFTPIQAIHPQASCTPTHYCLRLPGPSSSVITAVFRFCRRGRDIFRRPVRSRGLGSPSSGPCRAPGRLRTLDRADRHLWTVMVTHFPCYSPSPY